jgi:hypothetical protein
MIAFLTKKFTFPKILLLLAINANTFSFLLHFYVVPKCELAVGHRGLEPCGRIVLK